jgi:Sec-independent protein translocase protein TatA
LKRKETYMFNLGLTGWVLIGLLVIFIIVALRIRASNRQHAEWVRRLQRSAAQLEAENSLDFERGLEVLRAQPVAVVMANRAHLPDFDACTEVVSNLAHQEVADVDILDDNLQEAIHGHGYYANVKAGTLLIIGTVSEDVVELRAALVGKEMVRSTPTLTITSEDADTSQLDISLIDKSIIELVTFLGTEGAVEQLRGEGVVSEDPQGDYWNDGCEVPESQEPADR